MIKSLQYVEEKCGSCIYCRPCMNVFGCFRESPLQSDHRILNPAEESCEHWSNVNTTADLRGIIETRGGAK